MNKASFVQFRETGYCALRPSTKGFTLVELMMTLAVLAILLGIAVPGFQSTFASNRLITTTNDLVSAVQLIRMEAIRKNHRVSLCRSDDGASCGTGTGTWTNGWVIFDDPDHDATVDTGEAVLRRATSTPSGITIAGNGQVADYVSYAPDSAAKLTTGAFQTGTIRVCSTSSALSDDERARDIVINIAGRIITRKPSNISSACPGP